MTFSDSKGLMTRRHYFLRTLWEVGSILANSGIPGLLQAQRQVNLRLFVTGVFLEQELGMGSSSEQEGNPQGNLVSINSGATTNCITLGFIIPSVRIFQI